MYRILASVMLIMGLATPSIVAGQNTSPEPVPPQAPASPPAPAIDRTVSWKLLFPNILNDQQRIWSFPSRLVQGHDWIPATAVLGTTAALVALDPTEASYFRHTSSFHEFNNIFSGNTTMIGTIAAPLSLYLTGLVRKDSKMQQTALLAAKPWRMLKF